MTTRFAVAHDFAAASLPKKLALVGGAMAIFLLTLLACNHFQSADKAVTRQMMGHDFLAFYTAGSFVRDGRSRELYNLESLREFQHQIATNSGLDIGVDFAPWWNPPLYALLFEPLAKLPYSSALSAWRIINLASLTAAAAVLMVMIIRAAPQRSPVALLVPLLLVVSMPFIQSLSHGQNTMTSLLLLTITCALWRAGRAVLAGAACALLFFKPQLAAVIAVVMLVDLGVPALLGLGVAGLTLLAINCLALPATLGDWLHQLPANVHWIQIERPYMWDRHATLKAFWRLLLQGKVAGQPWLLTTIITDVTVAIFGIRLLHAAWRNRSIEPRLIHRERLITAAIITMPLLMPFYFDYDLMLLAIPATLLAIEQMRSPSQFAIDRRLISAWIALAAWLYVNPGVAAHTHINLTVALLSAVSWLSISRVRQGIARRVAAEGFPSQALRAVAA